MSTPALCHRPDLVKLHPGMEASHLLEVVFAIAPGAIAERQVAVESRH